MVNILKKHKKTHLKIDELIFGSSYVINWHKKWCPRRDSNSRPTP
jgi:hypothetical protein